MVAYGDSTAEPVHSTCEATYFGSTFVGSQQRGRWAKHPLVNWARTERPGIGYIRDNALTDGWGWMSSTDRAIDSADHTRPRTAQRSRPSRMHTPDHECDRGARAPPPPPSPAALAYQRAFPAPLRRKSD